MAGPQEERELLERAQSGDTAAAQILFLRNDDWLRRHVKATLGDAAADVDDVVRRAVQRAGKGLRRVRLEGDHPFRNGLADVANDECARRLVNGAKSGDRIAVDRLFAMYEDEVKQYLRKRLAGIFREVDDLQVEARWTQVRQRMKPKITTLEYRQKNAFIAFLTTIARNLCNDEARFLRPGDEQQMTKLSVWMSDGGQSPSSMLARDELLDALRAAIPVLSSEQMKAVELYLQGKKSPEIAAEMDITPGAARMLLKRARERLHEELGRTSNWFSSK